MTKFKLTRNVTTDECDWLDRDFKEGEILNEFTGCTYGCISDEGLACTTDKDGQGEFFEIPNDALEIVG